MSETHLKFISIKLMCQSEISLKFCTSENYLTSVIRAFAEQHLNILSKTEARNYKISELGLTAIEQLNMILSLVI